MPRLIVASAVGTTLSRPEPIGLMRDPRTLGFNKLAALGALGVCGGPASRNQRLIEGKPARYDSPTIMVGASDSYQARCRHCHSCPRADEDQVRLL